ncbi:MAG: CaiB/BaiF CoA transferase family protein [Janthinobacterium lividum]
MPVPLAGLRILEFSHTVMGSTAGLLLADLGADVVKVEPAPTGDHTRGLTGFAAGFFAYLNCNKRSLALDLKSTAAQAALHRLVPGFDIIIENYGPGTMERLGCGWEQLSALSGWQGYLALKGYLAGPYEHRPALDEVMQFHTGLAYMTGRPGDPLRADASVIDIMGAVFGVVGVQAAQRERTGRGQRVGSALFESAAFLMGTHMAGIATTGQDMPPMPARHGAWAIYQVFGTADAGRLFIGVTSDQQGRRFAPAIGLAGLLEDPRLAINGGRVAEKAWLVPMIASAIAGRSTEAASQACEEARVSWAPVGRPADLFADPHLLASGGLLDTMAPGFGDVAASLVGLPVLPLEFGDRRDRPARPTGIGVPATRHGRAQPGGARGRRFHRGRDRGAGHRQRLGQRRSHRTTPPRKDRQVVRHGEEAQ